jgi:hypothetical protein
MAGKKPNALRISRIPAYGKFCSPRWKGLLGAFVDGFEASDDEAVPYQRLGCAGSGRSLYSAHEISEGNRFFQVINIQILSALQKADPSRMQ